MLSVLLVDVPIERPFALIAALALLLVLFAALGMVVGIYAETWDHTTFIANIVILPLTFVGGVFYSVDVLPSPWHELSHVNPIFYLVNAVRFGFLGESDVSIWLSLGVLAALAVAGVRVGAVPLHDGEAAQGLSCARGAGGAHRGLPPLPATGGVARAGRAREAGGLPRRGPTGAGRRPASATRRRAVYVLGLAPAAHGANRTGRVFTGDRSGDWLFAAMHRAGFANQPTSVSRDDGLRLQDAWVAAAVRCAPPANKPTPGERDTCLPYAREELELLGDVRVVVCLGAFAWDAALRLEPVAGPSQAALRPRRRGHARRAAGRCSAASTPASRTPSPAA